MTLPFAVSPAAWPSNRADLTGAWRTEAAGRR